MIDFTPGNFTSNLIYLAAGMVGIFAVIGIIGLFTFALNKILSRKNNDK